MTFLNPLVLIGLVAAAIPLIIHLFNFRRPRRVDFSSLAFVKELQKSTMRKMRIKQWLLLLLRSLAILFLVLTFARPTLQGDWASVLGQRAQSSIAIVLDNSLSMTMRDGGGEYLAQARQMATEIIEQAQPGDEIFLVPMAGIPEGPPSAFLTSSAARDAVRTLVAGPAARTHREALAEAAAALESATHINREIYFVSDLQRSLMGERDLPDFPADVRVFVLPIGERDHPNIGVTDVQVASRIIEAGQPVAIRASFVNHGNADVSGYSASIFLEDERVAQASVDLPAGLETEVEFAVTPRRRGWLAGRVEIEEDAFAFDDIRHFALHVPERRNLLLIRGDGQNTTHLRLALSPELTRGRTNFDVTEVAETQLAATILANYDGVILAGPRTLSTGEISSLARFVEDGGGLLFFPSESGQAADYNAFFSAIGGGSFGGFSGALGARQTMATFDRADFEHPFFEGVFDGSARAGEPRLEGAEIYHAMNYRAGQGAEQTLIQMSNGHPFMQEIRHGDGAVLVLSVAADRSWSDLPVRGLFIPLMYRSVFYLSSPGDRSTETLVVGRPGDLRVTGVRQAELLSLHGPDGSEYVPVQRSVYGALLLETPRSIIEPGVYDVRSGDRLIRRIALNLDSRESNLETEPAAAAAEALSRETGASVRVIDLAGNGDTRTLSEFIYEDRHGVELWNIFLMLALACLVAEMLVSMQWRPEPVATASA